MNDRDLRDAFARLRVADAADAPPFRAPIDYAGAATVHIASPGRSRRVAWLVAASLLIVSAAGARLMTRKVSPPMESISTWRSPTDGLLSSASLATMTAPTIEALSIMTLPATHQETGR